jgi:hypothetical protein
VSDTLNDDPTKSLFKNILKKEGHAGGFESFGARNSYLSGRNSFNRSGRFSSKYGDNRLYLQRLSRNSIDSSQGLNPTPGGDNETKYKIRPKPRKYNKGEEMDESYFATNSNEDGNISREETTPGGDSGFFSTSKREFKILDKKISSKSYANNEI